jgi:L-fuconolactonase
VVDAHAHFWRWPTEEPAATAAHALAGGAAAAHASGPLTYAALLALMDAAGVHRLLQVTRTMLGTDNSYSLEGAAAHPDLIHAICRVDASAPDLPDVLDAMVRDPAVVGVRVHDMSPQAEALDGSALRRLWRELEFRGLPASVYAPDQLPAFAAMAREHPGLPMILDHAGCDVVPGGPRRDRLPKWREISALVSLPNVYLKVSGVPEAFGEPFPFHAARWHVAQLCDLFSPRRLMWGSNYPPAERAGDYTQLVRWVSDSDVLTDGDKGDILGGTAARVFGLACTVPDRE